MTRWVILAWIYNTCAWHYYWNNDKAKTSPHFHSIKNTTEYITPIINWNQNLCTNYCSRGPHNQFTLDIYINRLWDEGKSNVNNNRFMVTHTLNPVAPKSCCARLPHITITRSLPRSERVYWAAAVAVPNLTESAYKRRGQTRERDQMSLKLLPANTKERRRAS